MAPELGEARGSLVWAVKVGDMAALLPGEQQSSGAEHNRCTRRQGHCAVSLSHSWLTVKEVISMNCYKDPWGTQNLGLWTHTQECQTQNVTTTSVMGRNIFALLHNRISHPCHLWGPVTMVVGQVGKLMEGVRDLRSQIWVHILNSDILWATSLHVIICVCT